MGFPGGTSGKEHAYQCRRHKMWVRSLNQEDPPEEAWQPTAVPLAGEAHGQRSLAGYSPWGHKELDTTGVTQHACSLGDEHRGFSFPGSASVLRPVFLGLGTELSMWSSFFPSDGGSLTVWFQDDFSALLQGERTFSFALPQVTASLHLYVIYGWWCLSLFLQGQKLMIIRGELLVLLIIIIFNVEALCRLSYSIS